MRLSSWAALRRDSEQDQISNMFFFNTSVSLPRGWVQEIKRMYLVHLTHGLFLTRT
jgi:hypothetical protein